MRYSVLIRPNKCFRAYSTKQSDKYKYKSLSPGHVYNNLYPWKTRGEFVNDMEKSVVYHKGDLLVVNKPYGVAVNPPRIKDNATITETLSNIGKECHYTVSENLEYLKAKLNLKYLSVIKSPERFTSGTMLMATNKDAEHNVQKSLRRAKAQQSPPYIYWAVTTCIPPSTNVQKKVGIKLIEVPEFNQKAPVIETRMSNRIIKKGILKPAITEMRTIAFSNLYNCALVELATSINIWHFVRVYLAHQLAPILGDSLYCQRVKMVFGKPIAVSPFNNACYNPNHLPAHLANQLQVPEKNSYCVPTHLHLHQVTLKKSSSESVILKALPPPHFLWTLKRLHLISDTETIQREEYMVG